MIAFVDILFAAQSYFSPYGVFDVDQLAFLGPKIPQNIKQILGTKIVHTSGTFFEKNINKSQTIFLNHVPK